MDAIMKWRTQASLYSIVSVWFSVFILLIHVWGFHPGGVEGHLVPRSAAWTCVAGTQN